MLLLFFSSNQESPTSDVWTKAESVQFIKVQIRGLSSFCLNLCSGELVISTMKKVLLGTIKKSCCCCSSPYLTIKNENGKDVFTISMECCQWKNICPRWLHFGSQAEYVIFDEKGKEVGRIVNKYRSCMSSICCLRDDFDVLLEGVEKEKDKILLLNAVVFINQMKH